MPSFMFIENCCTVQRPISHANYPLGCLWVCVWLVNRDFVLYYCMDVATLLTSHLSAVCLGFMQHFTGAFEIEPPYCVVYLAEVLRKRRIEHVSV